MIRLSSDVKAENFISIPLLNSVESLTSTTDVRTNEIKTLSRKHLPKPPPPPVKIIDRQVPQRAAPPPPKKTSITIENTSDIVSPSSQVSSSVKNSKIKDTIEKFNQLQIQFK